MKTCAGLFAAMLFALAGVPALGAPGTGPVRIVVPAPAGGTLDAAARLIADGLGTLTGEVHVVENRPGADTAIGVEHVVRSAPDGRTLLVSGSNLMINPALQKWPVAPLRDLAAVIEIGAAHYVLLGSAELHAANAGDLARLARARPEGLNCAAPPGPMFLACHQLKAILGGAVTPVPYSGVAPALTALAGGHVDVMFVQLDAAASIVESRHLVVLAVSQRPALQGVAGFDAPLFSELWPGFVVEGVQGVYVPRGTPAARVRELNLELAKFLARPDTAARLRAIGLEPGAGDDPERFAAKVQFLSLRYADIVRRLGLSLP